MNKKHDSNSCECGTTQGFFCVVLSGHPNGTGGFCDDAGAATPTAVALHVDVKKVPPNFQTASKCTESESFWSEYKEPSLPCNWLMTQAALHVTRTDVTYEQIINPQQVQPSLFFSSCSSCSSMFSLCILKPFAKGVPIFFSSSFLPSALSFTPTPQLSQFLHRIFAVSVHARLLLERVRPSEAKGCLP